MKPFKFAQKALVMAIAGVLAVPLAQAGTTYSYTMTKKSYSGSRDRNYKVYVPSGFSGARPMVMVLHGCSQTNDDVLNDWGMKAKADTEGFILVAPFITSYDGMRNTNCWGFWFDQHNHQGAGEPEDLKSIALEVEANYSIDANKRYITGLSSGGAMTVVAAVTHNEYWTAAASTAGLPFGEDSASVSLSGQCPGSATFHSVSTVVSDIKREVNDTYKIPMMVIQSNNDCTVVQPAGRNIAEAHIQAFGDTNYNSLNTTKASEAACASYNGNNYSCKHTKYTVDGTTSGRPLVETVFFNGPTTTQNSQDTDHGHYWVGGSAGNEGKWAVKTGPDYPALIWTFFNSLSRNGAGGGAPPTGQGVPVITITGENPKSVNKDSTYSDPGATATDPEDGSRSITTDCNVNTAVTGEYRCVYTASDTDGHNTYAVRTVFVVDSNETYLCTTQSASPSAHISAGRAVKGGYFNLSALSKTDAANIGASYDTWSSVTLYQGKSGDWYSAKPAQCNGGGTSGLYCGTATVSVHQSAGRVADSSFVCKTVGGLQNVDPVGYSYTCSYQINYNGNPNVTIKETTAGNFTKSTCP